MFAGRIFESLLAGDAPNSSMDSKINLGSCNKARSLMIAGRCRQHRTDGAALQERLSWSHGWIISIDSVIGFAMAWSLKEIMSRHAEHMHGVATAESQLVESGRTSRRSP